MESKGNLFIVFTPLQLFVAQQIIRQEKLENCVLIEGWRGLFSKAYDLMRIEELWSKRIEWENVSLWNGHRLYSIKVVIECYKNYKHLKYILESNNVETIYLGEILNQCCRFTAVLLASKGYKIAFYEEGTSHYINRPYNEDKSIKAKLKECLLDYLYFWPVYGIKFAKWHSTPNLPYDELHIDKRYSIIPFHNKPFDVRLNIKPMFSYKVKEYLESNVLDYEERKVMLMTDPLRELMEPKDLYLYFDTIKECIESVEEDTTLYIKFHPREIEQSRQKILDIAIKSGKKYKVLSEEINICVEYYLQKYKFEKIYFFNAATYFYNGYAFPKTEFVKLMPIVYAKAKAAGVGNLIYMENMLRMIEPIALNH